jgi:hypothetical protein
MVRMTKMEISAADEKNTHGWILFRNGCFVVLLAEIPV